MKVYLANFFSKQEQMRKYACELRQLGIQVTSRWIDIQVNPKHSMSDVTKDYLTVESRKDFEDIYDADILILFTPNKTDLINIPPKSLARGGRHVEFGLAYAWRKRIILIGYRENVFHYLPGIECYKTWEECKENLKGIK